MAAGSFGVKTPDCLSPLKLAINETLRRGAPGHLLFDSILAECAGNRIPELFFGGPKDHYKELWTPETLPHFRGFVFAPGFRSQLACQINQVKTKVFPMLSKLRRGLRDRLERYHRRKTEPATQSNSSKKMDETSQLHPPE
jgi:CelD/BcsL family acetyltransferase involved in cellulose biosynthesis